MNLHGRKKESEDLDLWGNHLGGKQGNTSAIAYGTKMHDTLCTTATLTQECIKMKEFVIFLLDDVESHKNAANFTFTK